MGVVNYTVAQGRILAENRNGTRKLYRSDALGSTVSLYDNTQTKTDSFTYWPYGEVRTSSGSTPTKYKFVGKEWLRITAIGAVTLSCAILGCSNRDFVGEYAADPERSEVHSPAGTLGKDVIASHKLTLRSNGTFQLRPYQLDGKWTLANKAIRLEPTVSLPMFEGMMTGIVKQRSPATPIELEIMDGRTLRLTTKVKPIDGSVVLFVFVKQ